MRVGKMGLAEFDFGTQFAKSFHGIVMLDDMDYRFDPFRYFAEFNRRQIFVKDPDRGLVDFPAIVGGREVFLCWELDEDDIKFWHDIDSGFAGRERLSS